MTQFARASAFTTLMVQSSDPANLQALIEAALLANAGSTIPNNQVIIGIKLAAAGDGHTFVCLIDIADSGDVVDGNPLDGTNVVGGVPVALSAFRCYTGGDAQELLRAKSAIVPPPAIAAFSTTFPFLVADEQLEGGSKGTRFMGLVVYSSTLTANGNDQSRAIADTTTSTALVAATPLIATFTALTARNFSLTGGGQAITYIGLQAQLFALHASVTVEETPAGPNTVTVDIVSDPLGTPVPIGQTIVRILDATEQENISVNAFAELSAQIAVSKSVGLRITAAANGFLRFASMQIVPVN